jgi:hypothetical protein
VLPAGTHSGLQLRDVGVRGSHYVIRHDIDLDKCEVAVQKFQAELHGSQRRLAESRPAGMVFVGPKGVQLRRHEFRKAWLAALADAKITKEDVHFHETCGTPGMISRPGPVRRSRS